MTTKRPAKVEANSAATIEDDLDLKPPKTKAPSISKAAASAESTETQSTSLLQEIDTKRPKLYESVLAFPFNKKRCRVLSSAKEIPQDAQALVYWMTREQRVQDNWSLLYAQKIAMKQELPLIVCFCLVPTFLGATYRHYYFMLEGLKQVEKQLDELNIPFQLLVGHASERLPEFVQQNKIGGIICDFSPLRVAKKWIEDLTKLLPVDVPILQVDAHNVVPCWVTSEKLEYAARTIRNKINSKLDEYLTEFPPVVSHKFNEKLRRQQEFSTSKNKIDWENLYSSLKCDMTVKKADWATPGYKGGIETLESFIKVRLKHYDEDRNDPNKDALSNLSPWFHFGQISIQRCALEVKKQVAKKFPKSAEAFLEESIVRRELADNFCHYQANYDNIDGAYDWARQTLDIHAKDKRQHLYTLEQFENFKTHDILWNAAQIQMRVDGKMHGFLRMYWAKKILEWSSSPKEALEIAIYLNDKYQLDGRDPNGYVGCMWSICGIHDQGWAERPVYGKIRCMTFDGCKKKFNIDAYVAKFNNKKKLL